MRHAKYDPAVPTAAVKLEYYQKPKIPKAKVKQTGRDRLVSVDGELNVICDRLRQPTDCQ